LLSTTNCPSIGLVLFGWKFPANQYRLRKPIPAKPTPNPNRLFPPLSKQRSQKRTGLHPVELDTTGALVGIQAETCQGLGLLALDTVPHPITFQRVNLERE
jgi:hypothetical protein